MSTAWTWKQAIWESRLAATTKIVLQALASHLNDMGGAMFPSQARLARMCSLSERAVIEHLQIAERSGWIQPRKRKAAGKQWAANEYVAIWPDGVNEVQVRGEPRSGDGVNQGHIEPPVLTSKEKRERAQSLEAFLEGKVLNGAGCPLGWWQWTSDEFKWDASRIKIIWDTFRDHWRAKAGKDALKADWEATWRNWCRRETSFQKPAPLGKGEIRVRESTPEQAAEGKRHAARVDEFKRLSRLNENIGKTDQEIWELIQ